MKGVHVWGQNLSNARKWSARGTVWIRDTGHSGQFVLPRRPTADFGLSLRVGTRGSSTPFDAHLYLFGAGVFLSTQWGRRVAHWLTRGKTHTLSVSIHGGMLWWNLWVTEDHPHGKHVRRSGKYRGWQCRDGCMSANPLVWVFGRRRYDYVTLATETRDVAIEADTYPVKLDLQRVTHRYERRKTGRDRGLTCAWDAPKGIPTHFDHSGGWKGTGTYGASLAMPAWAEGRPDWPDVAAARLASWVVAERVRTGWTPEHEEKVADHE